MTVESMKVCTRCNTAYLWRNSKSTLKFQFCSALCETAEFGFVIDDLIRGVPLPSGMRSQPEDFMPPPTSRKEVNRIPSTCA